MIHPNHLCLEAITLLLYLHNQLQQQLSKKTKMTSKIRSKINNHKNQHNLNHKSHYLVRKHKFQHLHHRCLGSHQQVDSLIKSPLNLPRKTNQLHKIKKNNSRKAAYLVKQLVSHCLEVFQNHSRSQNQHNNKNNYQHSHCSKTKMFNQLQHLSILHQQQCLEVRTGF